MRGVRLWVWGDKGVVVCLFLLWCWVSGFGFLISYSRLRLRMSLYDCYICYARVG